jgi:hypothetical protein
MSRLYYAIDCDTANRATVSGVQAFSPKLIRDEFVNETPKRVAITRTVADTYCLKTHDCTAHEAYQRGLI